MITVVPDTNALHGQRWLTTVAGVELLELASAGACQVLLPQVVVNELDRQDRDDVRSKRDKAKTALRVVRNEIDMVPIEAAFDALAERSIANRGALIASVGIKIASVPENSTSALAERDLDRRRPFTETSGGKKSYGFRDAVIWETLLQALDPSSDDVLYFVTEDAGFLDEKDKAALHPHLLDDIDARGINRQRVCVADTISSVVGAIKVAVAKSAADSAASGVEEADEVDQQVALLLQARVQDVTRREEQVRVALAAIEGLVGESITDEIDQGGDYSAPGWVQFEYPSAMESALIVAIDLETDFVFAPPIGDFVTATADVILSIEGSVYKGDYFAADDDDLELVGELNDHYFETSVTVHARAVVEVDMEFGPGRFEVADVLLEDNPDRSAPKSANLQLEFNLNLDEPDSDSGLWGSRARDEHLRSGEVP